MDTSEQYIKMCEKAVEIQDGWKPQMGDVYSVPHIERLVKEIKAKHKDFPDLKNDYIYYDGMVVCEYCNEEFEIINFDKLHRQDECVWLPRQDQLQDMVSPSMRESHKNTHAFVRGSNPEGFISACLLAMFNCWCNETGDGKNYKAGNSMEQLWLSFVMHELHSKKWNGEDWVK